MRLSFLFFGLVFSFSGVFGQVYRLPDPGVDILSYAFSLELSDGTDEIRGLATVTVLGKGELELQLIQAGPQYGNRGMNVERVTDLQGQDLAFSHQENLLSIALPDKMDTVAIQIKYRGIPADGLIISTNRHGDRTFFGDNWPNRARHYLPVVDHPADKALVSFAITAPEHYEVVANGELQEESNLGDGRKLTRWQSRVPLPTKVMVFGAARFAVQYPGSYRGTPVSSWIYPQDREAGFYDYALALPVLDFFVSYLGPYPYAKLANVQSTTRYGGMENASNIFYSEQSVTGDRSAENLIAHEIAHQWFGNSASEADWPHIWLSEGFATYLTALYVEATHGDSAFRALMAENRRLVLTQGPLKPVVDSSFSDINQLLNRNSYEKGAWVLHMLRERIGPEPFQQGLRIYYDRFKLGNARTADLQAVMEKVSGQDLDGFFRQWLYRAGNPRIKASWEYDKRSKVVRLTLEQETAEPYQLPIELILVNKKGQQTVLKVDLTQSRQVFNLASRSEPVDLLFDPGVKVLAHISVGNP